MREYIKTLHNVLQKAINEDPISDKTLLEAYRILDLTKDVIKEDPREYFTRINNDINGNPRYVIHFLQCRPTDSYSYADTCKLMNKIGGRKFHNKQYGGGIVFQSYSLEDTWNSIEELKAEMKRRDSKN